MTAGTGLDRAQLPSLTTPSRLAIFLLSPRLIDFDTYLPTAMALKEARPDWDIRFVTFSAENADFIGRNPTLMRGLEKCGGLYCLDAKASGGRIARSWHRVAGFAKLCGWLLSHPRPIIFTRRQFTSGPYLPWYLLARIRRGYGVILAGGRSVDSGIHPHLLPKLTVHDRGPSFVRRLFGRDADALVHYHDRQVFYLSTLNRWGSIAALPHLSVGLPNRLPAWRKLIDAEVATQREKLRADGHPVQEIYCFFAPKTASSKNLRTPDSAQRTFREILVMLRKLRPLSTILVRPHPLADKEPYLPEALKTMNDPHIVVTLAHPEVLIALSRRAIVNAPTNVAFTSIEGRFIDCTDYRQEHYDRQGETSLGAGYGMIFVNPAAPDFEAKLAAALDDTAWRDAGLFKERDQLIAAHPPQLDKLLSFLENRT